MSFSHDDESLKSSVDNDDELAEILEEIGEQVRSGLPINLQTYLDRLPERADELRKLVATLQDVAALGTMHDQDGQTTRPSPSDSIGGFRLLRQIATGGMGVVYEATQEDLDRRVALKVLPQASRLDERSLMRFKNESRAAATLKHPHIVPIFSVGRDGDVYYYAMQYIDGPSLAEVLQWLRRDNELEKHLGSKKIPKAADETLPAGWNSATTLHAAGQSYLNQVLCWGKQAASALQHAHESGVIHRDIKPGNLLLDKTDNLWVTDFGLARLENDATLTMEGELLGTVRYMSPEQALAKHAQIDGRSDIYSLGLTLYELLTLQPAFPGNDRELLLSRIVSSKPKRPRLINSDIAIDVERILERATEKDPVDRYQSAQEMVEDIERYLEGKPVLARRQSIPLRARKWVTRNPAISVSAIVVFAALSTALAVALTSGRQVRQLAMRTDQLLYARELQLATYALERGNALEARNILKRYAPSEGNAGKSSLAWRLLSRRADRASLTFAEHNVSVRSVDCSPVDSKVASGDDAGKILIWDRTTARLDKKFSTEGSPVVQLRFSTDGSRVFAGTEDGHLYRCDLHSGQVLKSQSKHGNYINSIKFIGGETTVESSSDNREIVVWSENLQEFESIAVNGFDLFGFCHKPNGDLTTLKTLRRGKLLVLNNEVSNELLASFQLPASPRVVDYSPREGFAICGTSQGHVVQIDLEAGEVTATWNCGKQRVYDLCYSHDGQMIAVASKDRYAYIMDSRNGQILHEFPGHENRIFSIAFDANDSCVVTASADGTCKVFEIGELWFEKDLSLADEISQARISGRGDHLLLARHGGELELLNRRDNIRLADEHAYSPHAAFAPNNRLVATFRNPLMGSLWNGQQIRKLADRVDVDLDGDLDLVGTLGPFFRDVWQENRGDNSQQFGVIRTFPFAGHSPAVQRCLSGPLKNDIFRLQTGESMLYAMSSEGACSEFVWNGPPPSFRLIDDLNNDGLYEALAASKEDQCYLISTLESELSSCRSSGIKVSNGALMYPFDVDNDGRKDLVVADPEAGQIKWYRQYNTLQFQYVGDLVVGLDTPDLLLFHDIDEDGRPDLISSSGGFVVWLRCIKDAQFGEPVAFDFRLDSQPFAGTQSNVAIWNCETGKLEQTLNCLSFNATAAAFSNDGDSLAICGEDRSLRLFDLDDASLKACLQLEGNRIDALCFSPSDDVIAIGEGDDVHLWRPGAAQFHATLSGHESSVIQLLFTSDGSKLISLSDDHTAKIWDSKNGETLTTLFDFTAVPSCACFADDERSLIVGTEDGTLSVWDVELGQLLTRIDGFKGSFVSIGFDGQEILATLRLDKGYRCIRLAKDNRPYIRPASSSARPGTPG